MITSLIDLDQHRNKRHLYTSSTLCNSLRKENCITPFVLFSLAFIWHCHSHFSIDLFDNDDIQDFNVHNLYLNYPDIYNKKSLNLFFIKSKNVFRSIKISHMRIAIKMFEEDNGDSHRKPHGYLSSPYNIKQVTNNFTKSFNFQINDQDALIISNKLSCR